MSCDKYFEDINLLIDGNLNRQKSLELEEHMKVCESCRKEYEDLKSIKEILGDMEMKKLPDGFEEELKIKLIEASDDKSREKGESLLKKLADRFINAGPRYKIAVSLGALLIVAAVGISGLNIGGYKSANEMEMAASPAAMEYETAAMDMAVTEANMEEAPAMEMKVGVRGTSADTGSGFGAAYPEAALTSDDGAIVENGQNFSGRLIIKNADLSIEVEDFDKSFEEIIRIANDSGGFVENSNSYIYQRNSSDPSKNLKGGYISIRIPSELFDSILASIGSFGNVTNTNLYSDDISKAYRDTADEVKNLEVREARIREIMGKAEKIEDILKIEEELARVRGDINRLKGNLSNWEDLVSLSTININLTQVQNIKNEIVPVDKNVFQKAKEGFIETINRIIQGASRLFVYVIANLPIIIPVLIVVILVIRKLGKMNIF